MAGASTTTTKGPLILRCKKSNDAAAAAAATASASNASSSTAAASKQGSRSKLQSLRRRSLSEGDLLCEIDNALVLSKGFLFARGNEPKLIYKFASPRMYLCEFCLYSKYMLAYNGFFFFFRLTTIFCVRGFWLMCLAIYRIRALEQKLYTSAPPPSRIFFFVKHVKILFLCASGLNMGPEKEKILFYNF